MSRLFQSPLYMTALSGALMGSAFVNQALWWLGVVGLSVLIYMTAHAHTRSRAMLMGAGAGVIKMCFVYSWLWTVYPIDWMGNFPAPLQLGAVGWYWLVASVGAGSALGVFTYALSYRVRGIGRYVLFPLIYVAAEILGSLLFSLVELGPGSALNVQTSFGYLGYTLARHGVLEIFASGGGVYTLSFIIALIALGFADILSSPREVFGHHISNKVALVSCFLLFMVTSLVPSMSVPEQRGISVATVNTEYMNDYEPTHEEKANRVKETIEAFKAALRSGSDIIVFPETAYALSVFGTPENVFSFIQSQTTREVVVVDSGGALDEAGEPIIQAMLYDTRTQSMQTAFKEFLVPAGEYVPYHLGLVMRMLGFSEISEYLAKQMGFKRAPFNRPKDQQEALLPGVLFCSEIIASDLVYGAAQRATLPVIVHPISHGWFHTPHTFWYQLDLILRTQSRMAELPIVMAANMWEARAYRENGSRVQGAVVWERGAMNVVKFDL